MDKSVSALSNPMTSKNIIVDLLPPSCLNICDNTLSSWLKTLADKQCEVDWKSVDTSCLESLYGSQACDKSLKSIIELLIHSVCNIQVSSGCTETEDCGCNSNIEEVALVFYDRWQNSAPLNQAKAFLKDGFVDLKGRITGGSTLLPIANLPTGFRPSFERRVPFSFTFNIPNVNNAHPFLNIATNGDISIVWVGSTPVTTLTGDIFLDGIRFAI